MVMRDAYHQQLDGIVNELVFMTDQVRESVRLASQALLEADAHVAEQVISGDAAIDKMRDKIESDSVQLISLQQPVASDLRMLIAALRMVADLERMGDLCVHVAKVARLRVPSLAVPPEMIPTIQRMATVAEDMVGKVASAIADRDIGAARRLEIADDEMDQLRRSSFRQTLDESWQHGVEPAVDIALLGRYYERIADHAVSLARRLVYIVAGRSPSVEA